MILIGLMLAGCMTREAVLQEGRAIAANCAERRESGVYSSYYETTRDCTNPRLEALAIRADGGVDDLYNVAAAYRLRLARAIDEGDITIDDARLLQARLGVELNQIRQDRALQQAQQAAARSQNITALMQSLATYQQSIAPRSPPVSMCTSNVVGTSVYTNCF